MARRVCPWWVGYLLASPLRRWGQDPKTILAPYVRPGMIVLDVGCGCGLDAFVAAGLVGPDGRVVGLDLTAEMLHHPRKALSTSIFENLEFHEGSAEKLPFLDDGQVYIQGWAAGPQNSWRPTGRYDGHL